MSAREAEETARALARGEGLLAGISAGGATAAALRLAATLPANGNDVIVAVFPDRGDRYLSTGTFSAAAAACDPAPALAGEFFSALPRLLFGRPGPHWVLFRTAAGCMGGGGAAAAEVAAAAAARGAAEAGGGRLLEVVVPPGGARAELARGLMHHFALPLGDAALLVSWTAAHGPGPALSVAADVGAAAAGAAARVFVEREAEHAAAPRAPARAAPPRGPVVSTR